MQLVARATGHSTFATRSGVSFSMLAAICQGERMMPRPQTPALSVDVVIELLDAPGHIVLIERRHPPPGWALPGGFVDIGETVEQAAVREAGEETSLSVALVALLGVYSEPARDPRGHSVSVVYVGRAHGEPRGGDDARTARGWDPQAPPPLAFDHDRIVSDYLAWRRERAQAP
jgi:8-oxo-dGTP diphosphatase